MGKGIEEPLFQSKRRLGGTPSELSLNHNQPNPRAQDDYFILGRSDQKFAPSVAYRNSQRSQQRTRSFSPVRNRSQSQKSDKIGNKRHASPPKRASRSAKWSGPKYDEAIQTDEPRKALEQEIQRIRSEIEQRKRMMQENKYYASEPNHCEQQTHQKHHHQQQHKHPAQSDQLRLRLPKDKFADLNSSLNAPRECKAKQEVLRSYAQRPTTAYKYQGQHRLTRPTSPRPRVSPARLSEYQRAYKPPDVDYVRGYVRPRDPGLMPRPNSSVEQTVDSTYDTEYRREYKPFKYVSVEQLRSSTIDKDDNIHYVPLRRPISAYGTRDILAKPTANRALTPQPTHLIQSDLGLKKAEPKLCKKYQSEYNTKFRSYFKPVESDDTQTLIHRWEQELAMLRQQAQLYRQRDRGSHFTRDHFAQLNSKYVSYWDQPSTDRYARNRERFKQLQQMPRAGRPSERLKNQLADSNFYEASQLKRAMFDSRDIAQVLDQNDCSSDEWSSSSNLSGPIGDCPGGGCFQSRCYRKPNPSTRDRLAAVLPMGSPRSKTIDHPNRDLDDYDDVHKCSTDELLTSDDPVQVTSLEDGEQESDFETKHSIRRSFVPTSPNNNNGNCYGPKSEWHPNGQQLNHIPGWMYQSNNNNPGNGSLSTRSMMSSASLASATLERAKKRRDLLIQQDREQHEWAPRNGINYDDWANQFVSKPNTCLDGRAPMTTIQA